MKRVSCSGDVYKCPCYGEMCWMLKIDEASVHVLKVVTVLL